MIKQAAVLTSEFFFVSMPHGIIFTSPSSRSIRTDEDMDVDDDSQDTHGESGSRHSSESSDRLSQQSMDSDGANHLLFEDDEDESQDLHLSLEDIKEQLEAWAEPNTDGDFYEMRSYRHLLA